MILGKAFKKNNSVLKVTLYPQTQSTTETNMYQKNTELAAFIFLNC